VTSIDIVGKNEESVHEGNQKPGSSKIIRPSKGTPCPNEGIKSPNEGIKSPNNEDIKSPNEENEGLVR
jgi:hypothetical protein